MTKKERTAVDAQIAELKRMAAMRWTDDVPPDILVPSGPGSISGWRGSARSAFHFVSRYWSESSEHGRGEKRGNEEGLQGGIALYSSKSDALRHARYEAVREAASKLARIDAAIAAAEAEERSAG